MSRFLSAQAFFLVLFACLFAIQTSLSAQEVTEELPNCPDLVIKSTEVVQQRKGSFTLECKIRNIGGKPADMLGKSKKNLALQVFFSSDDAISEDDTLVASRFITEAPVGKMLDAGNSMTLRIDVAPKMVTREPTYFLVKLTPFTAQECNENNNLFALAASSMDLAAFMSSVKKPVVVKTELVTIKVDNQGRADTSVVAQAKDLSPKQSSKGKKQKNTERDERIFVDLQKNKDGSVDSIVTKVITEDGKKTKTKEVFRIVQAGAAEQKFAAEPEVRLDSATGKLDTLYFVKLKGDKKFRTTKKEATATKMRLKVDMETRADSLTGKLDTLYFVNFENGKRFRTLKNQPIELNGQKLVATVKTVDLKSEKKSKYLTVRRQVLIDKVTGEADTVRLVDVKNKTFKTKGPLEPAVKPAVAKVEKVKKTKAPKQPKTEEPAPENTSTVAEEEDGCADIRLDSVVFIKAPSNRKWCLVRYTITNAGTRPLNLYGPEKGDEDALSWKAFLSGDQKLNPGDINTDSYIFRKVPNNGILKPGESFSQELKIFTAKRTRFTAVLILQMDYMQFLDECDETNNKFPIILPK